MNNETKQDVFADIVDTLHVMDGAPDDYCKKLLDRYATALPDDLPVIPEAVGEWIIWCKGKGGIGNVSDAIRYSSCRAISEWIYAKRNSDTFARAWLLGVWRVEGTGEIVKLEAEKNE